MDRIDRAPELAGYWPGRWPAEDGGPTRRQTPIPGTFSLSDDALRVSRSDYAVRGSLADVGVGSGWRATSRDVFGANMVVLRDPGEVYLQGNTLGVPDTIAWVERIDPVTLEPLVRSPDLPGGPFWAGGVAVHRNGSLYVAYSGWCHRLDPQTLEPTAALELPRSRPYNSLLVLPDGHLVMKDFCGGHGPHALEPGENGSELLAVDPDTLTVVDRIELPEGSIARLSASVQNDGAAVVHIVGDRSLLAVGWDSVRRRFDPGHEPRRYLTLEGQTFGWDVVIADGSGWFLDDGEGTSGFGPSFRGKGVSSAPLHLVRVDLADPRRPPLLTEVCGRAGGIVANPPVVDSVRRVVVGYDSGNGVVAGWQYSSDPGEPLELLWRHDQDQAGHMLLDAQAGRLLSYDFDHDRGMDRARVLDVETGDTVAVVDTGSPLQTVLFPSPGWHDDCYVTSFSTVTRLHS